LEDAADFVILLNFKFKAIYANGFAGEECVFLLFMLKLGSIKRHKLFSKCIPWTFLRMALCHSVMHEHFSSLQCKSLGRPHGRLGRVREISTPPVFDPRTVSIASHYTVCATPARPSNYVLQFTFLYQVCLNSSMWI